MIATSGGIAEAALAAPDVFALPSDLPQFRLQPPEKLGHITDYYNSAPERGAPEHRKNGAPGERPLVILIQDYHAHYGTQKNIAALLKFLSKKLASSPVRLTSGAPLSGAPVPFSLAVEGASEVVDHTILANYPNRKVALAASDFLMREAEITGTEYFAIEQQKPRLLQGVEKAEYYNVHRDLFRKTHADREALVQALESIQEPINRLPRKLYTRDVTRLHHLEKAHQDGRMATEEYVRRVVAAVPGVGLKKDFPALAQFTANAGTELTAERMRATVTRFLLDTQHLYTAQERKNLEILSKAQQSNPYFLYLRELIHIHKLFLAVPSDLARRLEYIHTVETMGMGRILFESKELAYRAKLLAAGNNKALADLIQVQHDLDLLLRLTDLKATENEVRAFGPRFNAFLAMTKSLLSSSSPAVSSRGSTRFDDQKLRTLISSSIDYYALAMMRNQPMMENTLKLGPTTVLVAGGFHTAPITQLLRQRNVSYLVITPNIGKVRPEDDALYVKRLMGEHLSQADIVRKAKKELAWMPFKSLFQPNASVLAPGFAFAKKTPKIKTTLSIFEGKVPLFPKEELVRDMFVNSVNLQQLPIGSLVRFRFDSREIGGFSKVLHLWVKGEDTYQVYSDKNEMPADFLTTLTELTLTKGGVEPHHLIDGRSYHFPLQPPKNILAEEKKEWPIGMVYAIHVTQLAQDKKLFSLAHQLNEAKHTNMDKAKRIVQELRQLDFGQDRLYEIVHDIMGEDRFEMVWPPETKATLTTKKIVLAYTIAFIATLLILYVLQWHLLPVLLNGSGLSGIQSAGLFPMMLPLGKWMGAQRPAEGMVNNILYRLKRLHSAFTERSDQNKDRDITFGYFTMGTEIASLAAFATSSIPQSIGTAFLGLFGIGPGPAAAFLGLYLFLIGFVLFHTLLLGLEYRARGKRIPWGDLAYSAVIQTAVFIPYLLLTIHTGYHALDSFLFLGGLFSAIGLHGRHDLREFKRDSLGLHLKDAPVTYTDPFEPVSGTLSPNRVVSVTLQDKEVDMVIDAQFHLLITQIGHDLLFVAQENPYFLRYEKGLLTAVDPQAPASKEDVFELRFIASQKQWVLRPPKNFKGMKAPGLLSLSGSLVLAHQKEALTVANADLVASMPLKKVRHGGNSDNQSVGYMDASGRLFEPRHSITFNGQADLVPVRFHWEKDVPILQKPILEKVVVSEAITPEMKEQLNWLGAGTVVFETPKETPPTEAQPKEAPAGEMQISLLDQDTHQTWEFALTNQADIQIFDQQQHRFSTPHHREELPINDLEIRYDDYHHLWAIRSQSATSRSIRFKGKEIPLPRGRWVSLNERFGRQTSERQERSSQLALVDALWNKYFSSIYSRGFEEDTVENSLIQQLGGLPSFIEALDSFLSDKNPHPQADLLNETAIEWLTELPRLPGGEKAYAVLKKFGQGEKEAIPYLLKALKNEARQYNIELLVRKEPTEMTLSEAELMVEFFRDSKDLSAKSGTPIRFYLRKSEGNARRKSVLGQAGINDTHGAAEAFMTNIRELDPDASIEEVTRQTMSTLAHEYLHKMATRTQKDDVLLFRANDWVRLLKLYGLHELEKRPGEKITVEEYFLDSTLPLDEIKWRIRNLRGPQVFTTDEMHKYLLDPQEWVAWHGVERPGPLGENHIQLHELTIKLLQEHLLRATDAQGHEHLYRWNATQGGWDKTPVTPEEAKQGIGMHAVGGADVSPQQLHALQAGERRDASHSQRMHWAKEIRERRNGKAQKTLQDLSLEKPFKALTDLLQQQNPTVVLPQLGRYHVRFRILPGSFADRDRDDARAGGVRDDKTKTITLYLHADDLDAVVHEGLEHAIFPQNPAIKPSFRHTLAFLAETVFSSGAIFRPQRAMNELQNLSRSELYAFVKDYEAVQQRIQQDTTNPAQREALLQVARQLHRSARNLYLESTALGYYKPQEGSQLFGKYASDQAYAQTAGKPIEGTDSFLFVEVNGRRDPRHVLLEKIRPLLTKFEEFDQWAARTNNPEIPFYKIETAEILAELRMGRLSRQGAIESLLKAYGLTPKDFTDALGNTDLDIASSVTQMDSSLTLEQHLKIKGPTAKAGLQILSTLFFPGPNKIDPLGLLENRTSPLAPKTMTSYFENGEIVRFDRWELDPINRVDGIRLRENPNVILRRNPKTDRFPVFQTEPERAGVESVTAVPPSNVFQEQTSTRLAAPRDLPLTSPALIHLKRTDFVEDDVLVQKMRDQVVIVKAKDAKAQAEAVAFVDQMFDELKGKPLTPYTHELFSFFTSEQGQSIPIEFQAVHPNDSNKCGGAYWISDTDRGTPYVFMTYPYFVSRFNYEKRTPMQMLKHELSHTYDGLRLLNGESQEELARYIEEEGVHPLAFREFRANLWAYDGDVRAAYEATLYNYPAIQVTMEWLKIENNYTLDAERVYRFLWLLTQQGKEDYKDNAADNALKQTFWDRTATPNNPSQANMLEGWAAMWWGDQGAAQWAVIAAPLMETASLLAIQNLGFTAAIIFTIAFVAGHWISRALLLHKAGLDWGASLGQAALDIFENRTLWAMTALTAVAAWLVADPVLLHSLPGLQKAIVLMTTYAHSVVNYQKEAQALVEDAILSQQGTSLPYRSTLPKTLKGHKAFVAAFLHQA